MRTARRPINVTCLVQPICIVAICCCSLASVSRGAVIVVTNRTAVAISLSLEPVAPPVVRPREFRIDAGDCVPIPLAEPARMVFESACRPREYRIAPAGLYYFGKKPDGQID